MIRSDLDQPLFATGFTGAPRRVSLSNEGRLEQVLSFLQGVTLARVEWVARCSSSLDLRRVQGALALVLIALAAVSATRHVAAATFTFQEGASGYAGTADTYLAGAQPTASKGHWTTLWWDAEDPPSSGQSKVTLIRFEEIFDTDGGPIPQGSQITSATLTYTLFNPAFSGRSQVFEVLSDWSEAVTYEEFGGDGTPGVQPEEYGPLVQSAPTVEGTNEINVTGSLARWSSDPSSNKGWVFFAANTDLLQAWSSESEPAELRPMLTVIIDEGPPAPQLVRHPYLQLGTPDSIRIVWETDLPSDSLLRYGLSPSTLDQVVVQSASTTRHEIALTSLDSDTQYYYAVGTTAHVLAGGDANHYFVTAPEVGTPTPMSIWIVGDSGTGGTQQAAVRDAMLAAADADAPSFMLHMGDMAYADGTAEEFTDHFFTPFRSILRRAVIWPTMGAHEAVSSSPLAETGPYFDGYVLPAAGEAGGVPSGSEAYYSFDFGNVHFISLNSNVSLHAESDQLNWLAQDVAATTQDWLIAYLAHPPYSKGSHDSDSIWEPAMTRARENVVPILEAAGVDLVFGGHSHTYERSLLVDGAYDSPTTAAGHIIDSGDGRASGDGSYTKSLGLNANEGAVYVVTGNGGVSVSGTGGHPLMYFHEVDYGSVLLTINGQLLSMRHIRSDGVVSDEFQILKVPEAGSTLGALAVLASLLGGGGLFRIRAVRRSRRSS